MWELIRSNQQRSLFLFLTMGLILVVLGHLIGSVLIQEGGGATGVFIALVIWVVLSLISYYSGDRIVLALSGAREVTADVHPRLFNVVEEMKIAANLANMPRIYIIPDPAPNAFATGMKPQRTALAVTAGLLSRLNRDELQGVVAHEMAHILNRDVMYVTFAGMMLGSIVLLSRTFLRGLWFTGGRSGGRYRSRGSSKSGGQGQAWLLLVAVAFAILAPLLAQFLYFALSRKREYLADATAVRLTRYPDGLASALEKLALSTFDLDSVNKVTAPMFIVNPLKRKGKPLNNLSSTHPPIRERIRILRSLSAGVNYSQYQKVFAGVTGKTKPLIPASAMSDSVLIPVKTVRKEKVSGERIDPATEGKGLTDLMRAVNGYVFLACSCGLKIKVPPDFKNKQVSCPGCGKEHPVPMEALAVAALALEKGVEKKAMPTEESINDSPQVYHPSGKGWESFLCRCGKRLQLSPLFSGTRMDCPHCRRRVQIQK